MATKKPVKTSKTQAASAHDIIHDVYLDEQSDKDYYIYGTSTIEDRAIVGVYDGIKPVLRRILWAMHKLGITHKAKTVKAATIVGETMGYYHPHGDASIFDAAVNASQMAQPLIDGSDSNWGTMTSPSGAMRYINGRLTKYSDRVFFDPFYLPTLQFAANFDGSRPEPVNLVTLLPNGLLNGNFGICPGVNTRTPAFTLPSIVNVLKMALANKGECTIDMCMNLEWITEYGGKLAPTKANKAAVKEFYKTGITSVTWESSYKLDEAANTVRFNKFAPFSTSLIPSGKDKKSPLERLFDRVASVKGVASIDDDSESSDPYKQAYVVRLVRTCKGKERDAALKKLNELFSVSERYDVKVTDRVLDEKTENINIKLRPITVPQLISEWIGYRLHLEKAACAYWIKEVDVEIRYNEVMRLAIANLDFIIKQIKNDKLNDEQLVKSISKGLKITDAETNQILSRNLRQLRKLEDRALQDKIKELQARKREYEGRIKKPAAYVTTHLDTLLAELGTKSTMTKKTK